MYVGNVNALSIHSQSNYFIGMSHTLYSWLLKHYINCLLVHRRIWSQTRHVNAWLSLAVLPSPSTVKSGESRDSWLSRIFEHTAFVCSASTGHVDHPFQTQCPLWEMQGRGIKPQKYWKILRWDAKCYLESLTQPLQSWSLSTAVVADAGFGQE